MEESIESLKTKLWNLAEKTLDSKKYGNEFKELMERFGLSKQEILEMVIRYTFSKEVTNKDYSSMSMRVVLHLHNLIPGSYHQKRQEIIYSYLDDCEGSVIDVGFGVPLEYMFRILKDKDITLTLADKDKIAIDFARTLFEIRGISENKIRYKLLDMNKELPGKYDWYMFLDSIEHAENSTEYLSKIISQAENNSKFIFALPICSKDSIKKMHSIEWRKVEDALEWLKNCGLEVERYELITPNKEVDIFAFIYDRTFENLIVRCRK